MNKVIILDRDGVINEDQRDFIKTPEEWIPIPGSLDAIAKLNQAGFIISVCSNQSGVGRGIISEDNLELIHAKMLEHVERAGGKIDSIFYCPHMPDANCECRKPKSQMVLDICHKYGLADCTNLILVGDSLRDLQAIYNVGGIPALVKTGNGQNTLLEGNLPDNLLIFEDLLDFSNYILTQIE